MVAVGPRLTPSQSGLGVIVPTPVINTPTAGITWAVGQTINFSGSATDLQDGTLPPQHSNGTSSSITAPWI